MIKDKIDGFLKRFSSPEKSEKIHKHKLLLLGIVFIGILLVLSSMLFDDSGDVVREEVVKKNNINDFAIQKPKDYSDTLVATQQKKLAELEKKLAEAEAKKSGEFHTIKTEMEELRKKTELSQKQNEFDSATAVPAEVEEARLKAEETAAKVKEMNEKIELLLNQNIELKKKIEIGEEARKGLSTGQPISSVTGFGQDANINQNSPLNTKNMTSIEIPPLEQRPPSIAGMPGSTPVASAPVIKEEPKLEAKVYSFSTKTAEELAKESEVVMDVEGQGPSGYLPMGSFAEIVLMTGLDAGASTGARANPQPVLFRFQDSAFLPGEAKYRLESCMGLGSSYGDASSERAYIQMNRISCFDSETESVVESSITGYLVDSDGNLGFRGKLERRSGSLMAAAILAGFTQGLSQVFMRQGANEMTSAFGTTYSVNPGSAASSSLFSGSSRAAEMVAQKYLQEANSIFPIIEVQAGRKGHMVLQKGQRLKWLKLNEAANKDGAME